MPQVRRACVLAWGGAAVSWELTTPGPLGAGLASCAAFLLLAAGCALHIRHGLMAELRRSQEIAGAAQRALLRPLPGRIEGLTVAAAQLSASRGAAVGGDLYEAVPTAYGVRVVIGDVRGHGLPALGAAAAVLGAFREAAYDEPALGGVLVRMERALARHVRDRPWPEQAPAGAADTESGPSEEFVTVLLLQIAEDGSVLALNCGHPWPYLLREPQPLEPCGASPRTALSPLSPFPGPCPDPRPERRHVQPRRRSRRGVWGGAPVPGRGGVGNGSARRRRDVQPLDGGETFPPLGVVPVRPDLKPQDCGRLWPGDVLFLHTDGAEDARDAAGRFFPLRGVLAELASRQADTPARLVAGVHAALLRHTGGQLTDDVALLVLRSDRGDRGC
ncbi:PP2C family protein-serine/threonine phosphatase [Streptomyces sp. NRRL S-244]|uniref:PP2C family protein-serine/threonine phosphatase n=1 Tax=Streptomyces sp. NRRL S-244 TaxID=1463897 RepID=UPI00068988BD|nr:PP2C family protein-serine/threonine phosphatase [Streptomyces sp. NRRL S-244]